jgi:hypothetical protein
MIFYQAHGQNGACGANCSDWIAAEGVVEWDTFKRLFAFTERLGERKVPMVLNIWGTGNLKVATSLGKIICDRGRSCRHHGRRGLRESDRNRMLCTQARRRSSRRQDRQREIIPIYSA